MNQGGAVEEPPQGKTLSKILNGKDVVNQVNILCQVQEAGKYDFEFFFGANKFNCQCFQSFL